MKATSTCKNRERESNVEKQTEGEQTQKLGVAEMGSVGGISGCADVWASEGTGLSEARDSLVSDVHLYVCVGNHIVTVNICQVRMSWNNVT